MWKKHPVYTQYLATREGEIRHKNKTQSRKFRKDKDGYHRFNIKLGGRGGGKTLTVRRATFVAQTFIPNPENLATVEHKDGDKDNNRVDNLEWLSAAENTSRMYSRPHTRCHVVTLGGITYRSKREAEKATGVSRHSIK